MGGPSIIRGTTSTGAEREVLVDNDGKLLISGGATDGATATKQDAGNASVASIDAKFPAAAAMGDAVANGTPSRIGAWLSSFNGATWDRVRSGLWTAQSSLVGVLNVIQLAKYLGTLPTLTEGQGHPPILDLNALLRVREGYRTPSDDDTNGVFCCIDKGTAVGTYAPSVHTNFGAATKANVKATAGNVRSVEVHNINAAARYFQLFNKATAPAAGDTPIYTFWVGPASRLVIGSEFFVQTGAYFATGIGWAISGTTFATFTDDATANEHCVHIHYN